MQTPNYLSVPTVSRWTGFFLWVSSGPLCVFRRRYFFVSALSPRFDNSLHFVLSLEKLQLISFQNCLLYFCRFFKDYKVTEYARSGFVSKETVTLDAGPLTQFSHAIEPHLRQLGLPTSLVKGVVTLTKDHAVCQNGDVLTPEQCRILVSTFLSVLWEPYLEWRENSHSNHKFVQLGARMFRACMGTRVAVSCG